MIVEISELKPLLPWLNVTKYNLVIRDFSLKTFPQIWFNFHPKQNQHVSNFSFFLSTTTNKSRNNVCSLHKRNCFLVMKNNDNRRSGVAGQKTKRFIWNARHACSLGFLQNFFLPTPLAMIFPKTNPLLNTGTMILSFFGSVYMILRSLQPKMWPTSCCIIMFSFSTHETIFEWMAFCSHPQAS